VWMIMTPSLRGSVKFGSINNHSLIRGHMGHPEADIIMPAMNSLMTAKKCMDTLVNLYEKHAPSQKRTLKHKLKYLNMEKGE
jgi:hypothetical protein